MSHNAGFRPEAIRRAHPERSDAHQRGDPPDDHEHANDHFALIYESDTELFANVVPFIKEGLDQGEQCVYVVDERSQDREAVIEALRAGGVDVDAAMDSGALALHTVAETYLRTEPFDPTEMIDFYQRTVEKALKEYDGFRVAAGTGWIEEVPLADFMEYEGRVNALFETTDSMALCHYDRTQLSEEVIRDVIRTHPHLIYDETVCHNFYYVPPEELFGPDDRGSEVDRMLGTLRDRSRAKTELAEHKRFLRKLNEITADPDRTFEEKLQALFELGCERFDLELGGLNRVDGDADRFQVEYLSDDHDYFEPGIELPLSETFCRAPTEVMDTASVSDPVEEGFDDITIYEECGARAYIGTHLSIPGADDRTLAFISSESRAEPFSEDDRTYIELMGRWVKYELEHQHDTAQLAALNHLNAVARDINRELARQPTREEIETVVCERLAASDSYEFAWVGTVDEQSREIVPSTSANDQGYLEEITITADESPTGRGPDGVAVRTGEPQVVRNVSESSRFEPWRGAAENRGVTALAAIPIAHGDRQYGVLNVYTNREPAFDDEELEVLRQLGEIMGLAITAIEREQQLEYERERLEFVNRLLRHNLLNGLNAAQAHADILAPHVDEEGDRHLETIRKRIEDMTELITTLRSLMEIITDETHERRPVDLDEILRAELRQARETYRDARFERRGESGGDVLANGLLTEVFENLLVNAVEHNDAEAPAVTVTVERDAEIVTVRVADNGPGVPEHLQDRIFEKGQKDFGSPGTGFGLYLAREIVEGYGGSIAVDDGESGGAVFTVTLPRA